MTTKKVEILEGTEERVRERGFVYSSKQNNEDRKEVIASFEPKRTWHLFLSFS